MAAGVLELGLEARLSWSGAGKKAAGQDSQGHRHDSTTLGVPSFDNGGLGAGD